MVAENLTDYTTEEALEGYRASKKGTKMCVYLLPVLNPKSYDGARCVLVE